MNSTLRLLHIIHYSDGTNLQSMSGVSDLYPSLRFSKVFLTGALCFLEKFYSHLAGEAQSVQ